MYCVIYFIHLLVFILCVQGDFLKNDIFFFFSLNMSALNNLKFIANTFFN